MQYDRVELQQIDYGYGQEATAEDLQAGDPNYLTNQSVKLQKTAIYISLAALVILAAMYVRKK